MGNAAATVPANAAQDARQDVRTWRRRAPLATMRRMLRRRLLAALLAAAFPTALAPAQVAPDVPPDAPPTADVYVFHGEGCPHCATALAFLDELRADHPHVRVHAYEVWHDAENRALLEAFARGYRREVRGVPVIVLGDAWWTGFAAPVADGLRTRVAREAPFPDPRARLAADDLAAAVAAS